MMNLKEYNTEEISNIEQLGINGGGEGYARFFGKVIKVLTWPLASYVNMVRDISG